VDWAIGSDVDPAGLCSYMKALDFVSRDAAGSHGRVEFRHGILDFCSMPYVRRRQCSDDAARRVVHAENG
jgi:hypothetical protein